MNRVLVAILLLGGVAMAAAPADAQTPRETRSAANTRAGEPLEGVAISIETVEGLVVAKGISGPDGFVRVYNIPSGSYRVATSNTAKALRVSAARLAALRAGRPVPVVESPAVERPASAGLAMPVRPAAITLLVTGAGTSRERRVEVTALVDGMEMLLFSVPVSGPVAVSLRFEEE